MCVEAGKPVALSSDAHVPEHLGYAYDRARRAAAGRPASTRSPCSRAAGARLEPLG